MIVNRRRSGEIGARARHTFILGLGLAGACKDDPHSVGLFGGGATDAASATTAATEGAQDTGAEAGPEASGADGASAGEGIKFDAPSGMSATAEGGGKMGCQKADFLFVIDNSGSMGDDQDNLVASFPEFVATIQETLQGQDYHIMVVDGDAADICDDICTGGASFCALFPEGDGCEYVNAGCDATLGAGKIRDELKEPCPIAGGQRYMTHTQADLPGAFGCVAKVGTYGQGNEQPIGAMMAALSDNEAGGCNEGFLRDDAILVITLVADAPPETAAEQINGSAAQWFDAVVAAKNGQPGAISMLGLVSDGDQPGGLCSANVDDSRWGAPKLREFVGLFPHHVLASVCEPDYAAFFAEAVQIIDQTCDEFVPEG